MSRLRKTVVPFRWNAIAIAFTNGTAGSANLAAFLANPEGRTITYSVVGTLPTGVTLSGSTVSYNGAGAVASASVQFRAVSDTFTALSSSTAVTIAEAPVNNPAPTWAANTPSSLGSFTGAGTFDLGPFGVDTEPLTFARTGSVTDTAPGSVTVSSSGLVTIPAGLTAGNYTVVVGLSDGTNPAVSRTFTFSAVAATAGFTAEPGFSVTSSTGAFEDGATITITGSGFGTMGGDVLFYARGDEGTNGQIAHGSSATIGSIDTYLIADSATGYGGDDTEGRHLRFSNANTRTGRTMAVRRVHDGTDGIYRAGGFGAAGFSKTKLFVSWWGYNGIPAWTTSGTNYKQFYAFGTSSEMPQAMLFVPAGSSQWGFYQNIGDMSVSYSVRNNINTAGWNVPNTDNQWNKWDCLFELGTVGAYDGNCRVWLNGVKGIENTAWRSRNVNGVYKQWYLGYMDLGMDGAEFYFTDVYVADTQARVVISDSATWGVTASTEIQIARNANWADGAIQAALNKGAFGSLVGKYLFVVKSDGTALRVGSFS